ncbi:hypothetical protein B0A49_13699 [Cryomyces minteri]|uniref:Uncharacterized protein n=1 Tax=Cryomyces minteri TaxID=331657 RepID=A0A4U0VLX6_9PEZI|nr:hypothetical protein B0A49_13699 [Cryomyces minteri]
MSQSLRGQMLQSPAIPSANLLGRTIIVTGANSGLGLDCAKHLVRLNVSRLIIACRDVNKGESAKKTIPETQSLPSNTATEVWEIDQNDFESVVSFGHRVSTQLDRLDAVIANAGVDMTDFVLAEG